MHNAVEVATGSNALSQAARSARYYERHKTEVLIRARIRYAERQKSRNKATSKEVTHSSSDKVSEEHAWQASRDIPTIIPRDPRLEAGPRSRNAPNEALDPLLKLLKITTKPRRAPEPVKDGKLSDTFRIDAKDFHE